MCYIRSDKAPEDRIFPGIFAVVAAEKWSEHLRNHAYSYSNGSMAFFLLAFDWTVAHMMMVKYRDNH